MKQVTIHTDGACEGNPGPGGWAAVLQYETQLKEITGSEPATTNNRMELQAAIGALGALKEPCEVNLYTDSQYLRQGVTEWLKVWRNKGWKTSTKEPVKNQDLWQQLDRLTGIHKLHWHWVRGHAGHSLNENTAIPQRDKKMAGLILR